MDKTLKNRETAHNLNQKDVIYTAATEIKALK